MTLLGKFLANYEVDATIASSRSICGGFVNAKVDTATAMTIDRERGTQKRNQAQPVMEVLVHGAFASYSVVPFRALP